MYRQRSYLKYLVVPPATDILLYMTLLDCQYCISAISSAVKKKTMFPSELLWTSIKSYNGNTQVMYHNIALE